jgi:hypothetical protein
LAWQRISTPDGGDGDIKTGVNFYWTERFSGLHSHDAAFYVWHLPLTDQHISDTQAPEELMLFPSEIDFLPMDVQDGSESWVILDRLEDD